MPYMHVNMCEIDELLIYKFRQSKGPDFLSFIHERKKNGGGGEVRLIFTLHFTCCVQGEVNMVDR